MKTRNEVIQALKCCIVNEDDPCKDNCPYYREDGYCIDDVMADALELLQDPPKGEIV